MGNIPVNGRAYAGKREDICAQQTNEAWHSVLKEHFIKRHAQQNKILDSIDN